MLSAPSFLVGVIADVRQREVEMKRAREREREIEIGRWRERLR